MSGFRIGDTVDFTTVTGTKFSGTVVDYNDKYTGCDPTYTMQVEGNGKGPVCLEATADNMTHARRRRSSGGAS